MGTWGESGRVLRAATQPNPKSWLGRFRRWWIELSMPAHESDLTSEEWKALAQRYVAAGGSEEAFDALVERDVFE